MNKAKATQLQLQFLQQHPGNYGSDDALIVLKPDPIWNNLRSDPQFDKLWEGNALKPLFKI